MSKRSSTQDPFPLAANVLLMRCSAVSGRRVDASKGADAGGKARIASRERLRFSGLGGSGAAGAAGAADAIGTSFSAAWLGALSAIEAGDAGAICVAGLAEDVGFVTAGSALVLPFSAGERRAGGVSVVTTGSVSPIDGGALA